jgi:hypothetical protein
MLSALDAELMGHRQKGKSMKRKRSWHRLRNQDSRWERAMKKLTAAMKTDKKEST